MVSARVSPLGIEYRLVRGMLPGILGGLGNFRAVVGDLYGNVQKQDRLFRGEWNHLRLNSDLTELSAAADWTHDSSDRLSVSWGIRLRGSLFRPGRVADVTNSGRTVLTNAFLQIGYDIPEILETKVYVRADAFTNKNDRQGSDERGFMFRPEGGVSVGVRPGRHFRLEASADRTVQFYHTLEGLPVGWSLDMIVPSGEGISPETAMQASIGGIMDLGYHSLSAGVFHKWMDNLVYYRYAQSLFSGGMADYYSGINDFHMPTVLRLDLGYEFSFTRGRLTHNVNLGVCNVTNHFNPFIIYYEAKTETWKQLALLPVLPNFSWRIEF